MDFDAVKNDLIAEAERLGLTEYEIFFMEGTELSTETLRCEISSFSCGTSGGVSFRCVVDGHMGNASTELLTSEEMKNLVRRAAENAKIIENEDKAILFEGSAHYATPSAVPNFLSDTAHLKEMALAIQNNTYAADPNLADGTQSGVFSSKIRMELMNSKGLRLSNSGSVSGAYVQAVIQKDGEAREAFDFSLDLDRESLMALSRRTVDEAVSKLGAAEVESGTYDVIIDGKQMRALLSAYSSAFSAKNAQKGLSLLQGKEGSAIAADFITLVDDPMREGCSMQAPFDGEGVATYRKNVIENGVLKTLLYDLTTAERAGKTSTGNGQRAGYSDAVGICPYSFYLEAGALSEQEMFARLENGIYITEFKGLHAGCNAVTGDFSIESAGYRIRDGKICEAVKSFTVAGNFFDLLKDIEVLGDTVKFGIPSAFTAYGSPNVLVRRRSIAGT